MQQLQWHQSLCSIKTRQHITCQGTIKTTQGSKLTKKLDFDWSCKNQHQKGQKGGNICSDLWCFFYMESSGKKSKCDYQCCPSRDHQDWHNQRLQRLYYRHANKKFSLKFFSFLFACNSTPTKHKTESHSLSWLEYFLRFSVFCGIKTAQVNITGLFLHPCFPQLDSRILIIIRLVQGQLMKN